MTFEESSDHVRQKADYRLIPFSERATTRSLSFTSTKVHPAKRCEIIVENKCAGVLRIPRAIRTSISGAQ